MSTWLGVPFKFNLYNLDVPENTEIKTVGYWLMNRQKLPIFNTFFVLDEDLWSWNRSNKWNKHTQFFSFLKVKYMLSSDYSRMRPRALPQNQQTKRSTTVLLALLAFAWQSTTPQETPSATVQREPAYLCRPPASVLAPPATSDSTASRFPCACAHCSGSSSLMAETLKHERQLTTLSLSLSLTASCKTSHCIMQTLTVTVAEAQLFIIYFLKAQSTAQGHLRAFH